jgi:hypothetical protein
MNYVIRNISMHRKHYVHSLVILLTLIFPITIFAGDLEVRIQGFDDGIKSSKQQDYEEAVLFAKRQAIEKAGVTIKSKTTVENLMLQKDYIEAQSEVVLLPGYQILDIGYLENGTYSIILIGKIKTLDTKGETDADGFSDAKWGMSIGQVKEVFNFFFTDPSVTMSTTKDGNKTYLTATMAEPAFIKKDGCWTEEFYKFVFMDDKLYQVIFMKLYPPIISKEKGHISPLCSVFIQRGFNKEQDDLYKKYGKPIKSEEYDKIWVLPSTTITIKFKGKETDWSYYILEYEKR